ncbi:MAG: hypothetical protein ACK5MA_04910 [Parachlamydiaceae bacterium]
MLCSQAAAVIATHAVHVHAHQSLAVSLALLHAHALHSAALHSAKVSI